MKAPSFRRIVRGKKYMGKRILKVGLLSMAMLCVFMGSLLPVLAQNSSSLYPDYETLFSGTDPSPSLSVYTLFKQGTTTPDLKFNFQASFNINANSPVSVSDQKQAAWDHIVDSANSDYLFVIRICDASDTTETKCLFSKIPYGLKQGQYTSGVSPDNKNLADEIYHYYKTTGASTDAAQVDKFSVLFPITEVAPLSTTPGGGLGASVPISQLVVIGDQTQYRADAWYCAQSYKSEALPGADDLNDSNHRQFNDLCGNNRPYFKIATSSIISIPQTATEAEAQTPATIAQVDTTPAISTIPDCGIFNGSVMGCVAQIVYYLIYRPVAWFAGLLGELFDFFLGYSLSDASYRAAFAVRGWQIVRDISNVFFIIILVWVGLSTVFSTKTSLKKVIPNLIINALIINFSLFATRVVIDISNVIARVFYNSIVVCEGTCQKMNGVVTNPAPGIVGFTPLSEKIMSGFNPQRIFSSQVLDQTTAIPNSGTGTQQQKALSTSSSDYAGYFTVVSLIAAFIVFAIGMMFWKTAFFFLGRVIGLYVAMIFSPFAFLTRGNMPLVSGIKELSYDNWLKDLTSYAMLAPIFVFFLYIIYSVIESGFITVFTNSQGSSFFQTVLFIAIPMLIIYFMVKQGVDIAKTYAGKIGELVQNSANKVAGYAGGVALGGTALIGGRVLGGAATALNNSSIGAKIRDAAPNSWFARKALQGLDKAKSGSYDFRQTNIGKGLFKNMGLDTNQKGLDLLKGVGLGLSTSQRKGGFESDVKRRKEANERHAKRMEEKDENVKRYNDRQKEKYDNKIGEIINESIAKRAGINIFEVAKMQQTNNAAYQEEVAKSRRDAEVTAQIAKVAKPTEMKSAKDLNRDRKERYVKNLQEGELLGKVPLIGDILGAGVRETGDKQAAASITKDVKKADSEIEKKTKTENLVKDFTAKLSQAEEELKKTTNNFNEFLKTEAAKPENQADFAGKDITKLTEEEQRDLVERYELSMSGNIAIAQASYDQAVKDFIKDQTDEDSKALVIAKKKDLEKTKRDAEKGTRLMNQKNKNAESVTR
ncbi:MAG TPA: hypothetical protein VG621_01910, partial [Candidatus Paceibacterota bacterium]|nr:hypothetical protein [Candidatus Paceibacterota bacterium]